MATASYAQFIAAVQALDVVGVNRKYPEPPQKFNSADLPCSFVWFPAGDNKPLTFGGGNQLRARVLDFIIVYADATVTPDMPFTETVALMDAVETALSSLRVGQSKPSWDIKSLLYQHTEDLRYWAVIATVSGTG